MISDFLDGAVDIHVHSSPDIDARRFDDIQLALEAKRAGMAAVLLKSHQNSTVERAYLTSKAVGGISVLGGLVLNETVGGFNPAAVKLALTLGARQIWMPTRSAANHRRHHGEDGGLTILHDGQIRQPVLEILDLIAETDCVLGTGHLSPEESCVLIPEALRRGVRRTVITHPEWSGTYYPIELQKELSQLGEVYFERCFVSTTHRCGFTPLKTIADAVAEVGVGSTILSTDLGQPDTPPPAEGFRLYAEQMRGFGFTVDHLHTMMSTNPARLLFLNEVLRSRT